MLLHITYTVILYYLVSEPETDQMLNLTSVEVLNAYLDSFISPNVTINNIGSSDGLSAGAIAGIVVSVIVIIIVLVVISAVSICICKHFKHKIRYSNSNLSDF